MAEITRQIKECVDAGLVYEYKKTDYPKHCSPCFLVAKPGSTAKRLVVDYKKVNQKKKLHSGSLPLMENTVETAAGCRYKTKMDKRSGLWQIDLTERAQDLTAFIASDGRVYKWRPMPFGIANAPALFQELMNQIIALCKPRSAVQELLQRGAVLEAHIDDVILGTNTMMTISYYSKNCTPSVKKLTSASSWRNANFSRRKQNTSDSTSEIDGGNRRIKR